jgi:hypothetical protein
MVINDDLGGEKRDIACLGGGDKVQSENGVFGDFVVSKKYDIEGLEIGFEEEWYVGFEEEWYVGFGGNKKCSRKVLTSIN